MSRPKNQAPEYFSKHIKHEGEHWIWTGPQYRNGAGYFMADGERITARRYSYEAANGELPKKSRVRVDCGQPKCVNPEHLRLPGAHGGRPLKFPRHCVSRRPSGGWVVLVQGTYVGYFRNEDEAYAAVVAYRRLNGLMNDKYERLADEIEEPGLEPREVLKRASESRMKADRSATFKGLGVSWCSQTHRWQAMSNYQYTVRHLGRYTDEVDAYIAVLEELTTQGAPPKRTQPLKSAIESLRARRADLAVAS